MFGPLVSDFARGAAVGDGMCSLRASTWSWGASGWRDLTVGAILEVWNSWRSPIVRKTVLLKWSRMARYFFDTFNGETWVLDEEGIECADHRLAKARMRHCPTSLKMSCRIAVSA